MSDDEIQKIRDRILKVEILLKGLADDFKALSDERKWFFRIFAAGFCSAIIVWITSGGLNVIK